MGYQVTVTEFTGWEHSLKNELILASKIERFRPKSAERLESLLAQFKLEKLHERFKTQRSTY
jgi:hypothetical protein